jgi:hypothetical protein
MAEKYVIESSEPKKYISDRNEYTPYINNATRFTRSEYLRKRNLFIGWHFYKIEEDGKLTKVSNGVCGGDQIFDWLPGL